MKKINGNVQRQQQQSQQQQLVGSASTNHINHTAVAKKISPGCFTQQFMLQDVIQEGNTVDCRHPKNVYTNRQEQVQQQTENITTPWMYPQVKDPAKQLTEIISKQILTSLKTNAQEKMDCFLRHKSSKNNSITNGEYNTNEEILQKNNQNSCCDCGCPSTSSLNGINSDNYSSNPMINGNYMCPQGSLGSSSSSSVGVIQQPAGSSSSQSSLKAPSQLAIKPQDQISQDKLKGIFKNGSQQLQGFSTTRTGQFPKNHSVHTRSSTNYQQNMPKQNVYYGEQYHNQQDFATLFPKSVQQTARDNFYDRFSERVDKPQTATLIKHNIEQRQIVRYSPQPFSADQTFQQFYSQIEDDNQNGQNNNIRMNNNINQGCIPERKIRAHSHFTQTPEMINKQNGWRGKQGNSKNLEFQGGLLEDNLGQLSANQGGVIPLQVLEERHQKQLDQFRLQAEHYDPRKLQWSVSENHTPRKPATIDFQRFQKQQHQQQQQGLTPQEESLQSGISRKLESERKVSQDKIFQYQQDIQIYQAELLTVKRELESLQNQQTAACDMNMLNAQLESLQNVFTDKKRQLEAEIEQSNQVHTHLKNKLHKANIQATSMKNIIENLTAQNTLLRQQLQKQQQQMQQTCAEQNEENERLKQGIDKKDQIIGQLENRIVELNGRIEELLGQQEEFREVINELTQRKIEYGNANKKEQEQVESQGQQQYLMEIEELKKKIEKLSENLRDSEGQRSDVNFELSHSKDELEQVKSTVQVLISEKANITEELQDTKITFLNCKSELSSIQDSLSEAKSEIQDLNEQFQRKQDEVQQLQSLIQSHEKEKQIIENTLKSTQMALQAAQEQQHPSNQQEIDNLKQQIEKLQSDQQDLLDDKERLTRKKVEKEKRVDELVSENDKISELYDNAKAEVDALTLQLRGNEERNEEIERLNEEIRLAREDIDREKDQIKKERDELEQQQMKGEQKDEQLKEQMELLGKIEKEISERKNELKEIEEELDMQRKSLDAQKLQMEEEEQAYKTLTQNHEQQLQQQQQFVDGEVVNIDKDDIQGGSSNNNNNTTTVSNSTSSNSNSQLPQIGSNRVCNSSSESIKHCCEGANQQQQQCNACIKNTYRMQQYKEKKKQYRERLKASENKLCELQRRVKEETSALRNRIECLEEEQKTDQKGQIRSGEKNLDGVQMVIMEEKEKELGNLKDTLRNLESRIVSLQVRNGQLEGQLEKSQKILGETQSELKNVEEQLRVCKSEDMEKKIKGQVKEKGKKSEQDGSDDELAEKEQEIESLEEDKKLLQEELQQKDNLIYEYMDAIAAQKKEISKIQGEAINKEELIKDKDKELDRNKELEEIVQQLKEELKAQEIELAAVKEQVVCKEKEILKIQHGNNINNQGEYTGQGDVQYISGQSSVRQSIGEEELRKLKGEFLRFEEALKTQLRGYQEDENNHNNSNTNDYNDGSTQNEMKKNNNSSVNDNELIQTLSKQELLESAQEELALISKKIKQLQEEIAQSSNLKEKYDDRNQEQESSIQQRQQISSMNLNGKPLARARFLVSQTASSEDEDDQVQKEDNVNKDDQTNQNQNDQGTNSTIIAFDQKEKEEFMYKLEELKEACQLKEEKINRLVEEISQFSVKMSQREEEFNQQIEDNEAYYLKLLKRKNDEYSDLSKEYESLSDNYAALNDKIDNLQKLQKESDVGDQSQIKS